MVTDLKEEVTMSKKIIKADNWDGKSRPSNKAYEESWNRIFGKKDTVYENDNPGEGGAAFFDKFNNLKTTKSDNSDK